MCYLFWSKVAMKSKSSIRMVFSLHDHKPKARTHRSTGIHIDTYILQHHNINRILKVTTMFLRHPYCMALWLWSIKAWLTLWLTIKIKIKFKYSSNRIDRTYLDFLLKFVLVVFVVVLFHGNNLVSDNLVRFYIRF